MGETLDLVGGGIVAKKGRRVKPGWRRCFDRFVRRSNLSGEPALVDQPGEVGGVLADWWETFQELC
jgi:hypothetical protein